MPVIVLSLLLVILLSPSPGLQARWDGSTASVVTWTQRQRGCLYHETQSGTQTFVGCYDGAGVVRVSFGRVGPMDGALRPRAGSVYVAQIDGVTYRARLEGVVRLPLFRA